MFSPFTYLLPKPPIAVYYFSPGHHPLSHIFPFNAENCLLTIVFRTHSFSSMGMRPNYSETMIVPREKKQGGLEIIPKLPCPFT